jgi:OmpA-OmpF porin, OOP family
MGTFPQPQYLHSDPGGPMQVKPYLVLCLAISLTPSLFAQAKDAEGCKDSPLISRFPGSVITGCDHKDDDVFKFTMASGTPAKEIEGKVEKVDYAYPKTASKAQVVRNMVTALHAAGYTFLYDSGSYGDFTLKMGKTWLWVSVNGGGDYHVVSVEEVALSQDVVANAAAMQSGLQSTGHTVVNGIQFDTGKADVKPESAPALQEVVKLLQQDPKLKIYVVGHTDNVGVLASNLDLSRRRAAAVVQLLETQYHIAADRLAPFGNGPYAPIQSNDSEDGRAVNRRVELVKQ